MLPKGKRLTRADFRSASLGTRAVTRHFSVTFSPSRIGKASAVVSKKVAKKAVDRHQLRRRILDAATPYVNDGHSFIVYARNGSESLTYRALAMELSELLKRSLRV